MKRFLPLLIALVSLLSACGKKPSERAETDSGTPPDSSVVRTEIATGGPIDPFLDSLQHRSFRYFWNTTDPATGLTPDRYPSRTFSSIAAIGFGLSSYLVGAERQYVSREAAARRTLNTLQYLWKLPQHGGNTSTAGHKGFYYHFLNFHNGLRYQQVELSTIDTGLLLMGVLSAQVYFDGDDATETRIRSLADSLYRRVEWPWFAPRANILSMGWHPESRKFLDAEWKGYNEAMLLYVLAFGSPTHPLDSTAWQGWTSTYQWGEFQGQEHLNFAPLFGHQYSHAWIDFRGIQDDYGRARGIDYFENSRRATYANRAYCMANPRKWKDYGANVWGLTACDGPADVKLFHNGDSVQIHSYWARGASLQEINDDGTIAPTAAGGSIPFAPEICIPALKQMYKQYGDRLWGEYGFYDAFNPTFTQSPGTADGWFDTDYLGIDNGPIVLMIENYRSGFLWNLMKKNPYIVRGLQRAGFRGGWLEGSL